MPTVESPVNPEKPVAEELQKAPKEKIVRNREVDKVAESMAKQHVLPLPAGKNMSWDQMQQYMGLLTPEMWSHFSIYVYRLRPKIRRQLNNPNHPNYIDLFSEPFTLDYFIKRHGGGKYMLEAVDTQGKNGVRVFDCIQTIDDTKYPPILDYAELELEARENTSYITWLKNQGILDSKGQVVQQQQNNNNGNATNTDVIREVLNFIRQDRAPRSDDDSLGKSIGTILVERMKQDDPSKQWETVATLLSHLKDDPSKQMQVMTGWLNLLKEMRSDSSSAPMLDKIIAMQDGHNKTVLGLLERFMQQNTAPPKTALDEFDKVFSLLDRARQWGGSSGRRSGWDVGLEIAKDVGLPVIQTLGGVIMNAMALRHGQPVAGVPGAATPPIPAAWDPYRNPGATAAYAAAMRTPPAQQPQPQPQPAPTPPPQPNPEPPQPDAAAAAGMDPNIMGIFQQYGGLVLNALNNGIPGYEFADSVIGLLGTGTHAAIANYGEVPLTSTMMTIPEFQMFGQPRIAQFTHEFVHYTDFGEEEEEAIEPDEIDGANVYRPGNRPAERSRR